MDSLRRGSDTVVGYGGSDLKYSRKNKTIKRFSHWSIVGFVWFLVGFCIWGFFIDREPPVTFVSSDVKSIDRVGGVMIIENKFITNRYCGGWVDRWLRDGVLIPIARSQVTPEGFWTGHNVIPGETVTVDLPIPIPPYLDDHFIVKTEISYHCDLAQYLVPIIVHPPFIEVGAKNELSPRLSN